MRQGRCWLSADAPERVLDRLAGLEQVISPTAVRQALRDAGRTNGPTCVLTQEVLLWVVVAMGVFTNVPIRQVYKLARRLQPDQATPGRAALCMGRRRLGVEPVRALHRHVVRPLATPQTRGAFYHQLRRVGIDGVAYNLPDTAANVAAYGRPTAGAAGDGPFPQIRKVSLVELGTHVEFAFRLQSAHHGSERDLLDELVDDVPADSLLHADEGFYRWELWDKCDRRGFKLLWRAPASLALTATQHFADGSFLTKIYPSSADRLGDRQGRVVRALRYTLDDPQRTGHDHTHLLLTNLLDADQYPAAELIAGYHERWEEELVFDEQKTHQDPPRASKSTHLRSKTPAGVEQELYALSLGHFVVRALMTRAAESVDLDPDRLSFTGCFQILQCRLPEAAGLTPAGLQAWHAVLCAELAQERTDPRRNRINPRVVKQDRSRYPKKTAADRHRPPLKKTFAEAVVMLR